MNPTVFSCVADLHIAELRREAEARRAVSTDRPTLVRRWLLHRRRRTTRAGLPPEPDTARLHLVPPVAEPTDQKPEPGRQRLAASSHAARSCDSGS